ncbi:MAG: 16S rRNA (cytosine(1402)-N(4))-methyltransferase RsmH [Acidobacteriota bacterium]
MGTEPLHVPVMVREVVESLRVEEGGWYVDCTLGLGGHSRAVLEANPSANVLGVDRDPQALALAREALAHFGPRMRFFHANFKDVDAWRSELPEVPRGILADLGMSGLQLRSHRGFSFQDREALDMRMDPSSGPSAEEFLAGADEGELMRVLRTYGEEPHARRIARAISAARSEAPITDAARLAEVVSAAVPPHLRGKIHPATRTFQALRIHVNRELEGLGTTIERCADLLCPGGRIVILAYHSLEDRIVKETFRSLAKGCICPPRLPVCACGRKPTLKLVHRRALRPSDAEVARNPASRSGRLRAGERL